MKKFTKHLSEHYVNAVGTDPKAIDLKRKWADQVWDMLQKSYASIGGLTTHGFETKESMIMSIPFWKLAVRNGVLHAVIMYKDKGGRKTVAIGSDGSEYGKQQISTFISADLKRGYTEKSKAALGSLMKTVPWSILKAYAIRPTEATKLVGPKYTVTPIRKLDKANWPTDAKLTIDKYPMLLPYGYVRELHGKQAFKVMFGTPGKHIT